MPKKRLAIGLKTACLPRIVLCDLIAARFTMPLREFLLLGPYLPTWFEVFPPQASRLLLNMLKFYLQLSLTFKLQ